MVLRIHNVGKWSVLEPGHVLNLKGEQLRKVRVDVNCERPTPFHIVEGGELGRITFVGVVTGLETLEFSISGGEAHLTATSDGEVWYFTNDGDSHSNEDLEPVNFATIIPQRAARNPEMERMMWRIEQNMNLRLQQQQSEFDAIMAQQAQREAAAQTPEPPKEEAKPDENGAGASAGTASKAKSGKSKPAASEPEAAGAADGDA